MELIGNNHMDVLNLGDGTSTASVAGYLDGLVVDLFQADLTPTRNTSDSTYIAGIANYDGYTQQPVVWGLPTQADDGFIEVLGSVAPFQPNGSDTPNTIFGLFCTMGDGSLGFAGRFDDPPIPMGGPLDQITVTLRYRGSAGGLVAVIS